MLSPRGGAEDRQRRSGPRLIDLRSEVVGVAPHPTLARLDRSDHRMMFRLIVLRGVLVLRRVAAADVTAGEAFAQMHPRVVHLQAFYGCLLLLEGGLTVH